MYTDAAHLWRKTWSATILVNVYLGKNKEENRIMGDFK